MCGSLAAGCSWLVVGELVSVESESRAKVYILWRGRFPIQISKPKGAVTDRHAVPIPMSVWWGGVLVSYRWMINGSVLGLTCRLPAAGLLPSHFTHACHTDTPPHHAPHAAAPAQRRLSQRASQLMAHGPRADHAPAPATRRKRPRPSGVLRFFVRRPGFSS
jgi:hypothetical protein